MSIHLRALIVLAALSTLSTLSISACTLTEYPSGAISCVPGPTACPAEFACLDPKGTGPTCIRIGCGDGQVDSATEQCDDANANDFDLCVDCRLKAYVADQPSIIGFGAGDAKPLETPLGRPTTIVATPEGTLFIGSISTNTITRFDLTAAPPRVTAFAGNGSLVSVETTEATPPNEITTVFASSLAVDGLGNLFISDLQPSVIRRIDAVTGAALTIAGNETRRTSGDDVIGSQSSIALPTSLAIDGDGTLYFIESGALANERKRVRRLDRVSGRLTTLLDNGSFNREPDSLAFDDDGVLYVFTADVAQLVSQNGPVTVVDHFMEVAKVDIVGTDAVVRRPSLRIPVNRVRVVVDFDELDPDGNPTLVSQTVEEETACFAPEVSQQRFALRRDGRRAFFPAGQRFMQMELPGDDDVDGEVICTTLGEAPNLVEAGSAFNLKPTDVALSGASVFFTDPGNGVVWSVQADLADQVPKRAAGAERPPVDDEFAALVNDLVLEFAKETDGHLVVGLTEQCGGGAAFEFTSFEFFAPFPELHRVLLSDCANNVSVLAGNGTPGFDGDGGPAVAARLDRPAAAARGPDGHVYIADSNNDRIRRVRTGGVVVGEPVIETFLGPGGTATGPAGSLRFQRPAGIAVDEEGGLLIADSGGHRILRVDVATGAFTTVMGTGVQGHNGDTLPAAETQLDEPSSIVFLPFELLAAQLPAVPPGGLLIVAERGGHRLRAAILPPIGDLDVFTLAGDGEPGDRDDLVDGKNARFFHPRSVMLAPPSRDQTALGFFVVDAVDRIRAVSLTADLADVELFTTTVTTATSRIDDTGAASRDDGEREAALFNAPSALAVIAPDRIVVVDRLTGRLRLVQPSTGLVRTVSGLPDGFAVGAAPVPAFEAEPLREPAGVALDLGAEPPALYVSESGGARLRRFVLVDPQDPKSWTTNVVALDRALGRPAGLAVDVATRALFIADAGTQAVYRVDLEDVGGAAPVDTEVVAGVPFQRGATGDGGLATRALLNEPEGVAVLDDDGGLGLVLLVADTGNNRVRRVALGSAAPTIDTVLGDGDAASGGEGSPSEAFPVQRPRGLAVDARGNLLVTSTNAIRFVQAGDNGVPDADDDVRTIYGKPPRLAFPDQVTRCLSDLALAPGPAGEAPAVYVVDSCLGTLVRLDRAQD
ncbi:MAG: hypothetical protein Q8O67_19520 [Deltaproteobacteria bacterium]|nr:hypothetical protein [Deltaproteobacteria bacterium]